LSDERETDSRLHLEKIKNIIPKLNEMGKRKGAAEKRCMITLYAASSLTNLKYKGHINKKDRCRYFSISTLRDIAKNEEKIFGPDADIFFDTDTAVKVYKKFEQQYGYVKFLSKQDISKDICLGDTSPVTITEEGKKYCKNIIVELLDESFIRLHPSFEEKSKENASTINNFRDDLGQIYLSYGLNWLPRDYFKYHRSTDNDLDDWKKGSSFDLSAIRAKRELRREKIIEYIKSRLNNQGKLLIVGQSGSSKSTVLMELMCDYIDDDFEVVYNYGNMEIRNPDGLAYFIEGRLKKGIKVLVAVDNAHDERTSSIFYVIDRVLKFDLRKNIRVILTARLPEFDLFVKQRLDKVPEEIRKSISKLTMDPEFIYYLSFFTKEEVMEFIKLYSKIIDWNESEEKFQQIYAYSKGHPIMVKFLVFGQGLDQDVKERIDRYLKNPQAMKTMLISSLLDISNVKITDRLLERCGVLKLAYYLKDATLYQRSEDSWETIHARWDEELLYLLYNEGNKAILLDRMQLLQDAIYSIFDVHDETLSTLVIETIYTQCLGGVIPISIVEKVVRIPQYLGRDKKCILYMYRGYTYHKLKRFEEAIASYDDVLEIDQSFYKALNNKGLVFRDMAKYEEAIACYDKALEIEPKYANALYHKGLLFEELGRLQEALFFYDEALKVDPICPDAWNNKGNINLKLRKYDEAIECYDRELQRDPLHAKSWNNKGLVFDQMGREVQAIESYDKALELDRRYLDAWINKALALFNVDRHEEAIECYDKALELDPGHAYIWNEKGTSNRDLGKYDEAIECYDKALELDPMLSGAWNNKGLVFTRLGRFAEAVKCYDKASDLDPELAGPYINKAVTLSYVGRNEEALPIIEKALEIEPKNIGALHTKSRILYYTGKLEDALRCCNRAIDLDPINATSWSYHGNVLEQMKQYEDAFKSYDKATEIDPTHPVAVRKKVELMKKMQD
jgi:tetratricopeptide (TPR) repeat protein